MSVFIALTKSNYTYREMQARDEMSSAGAFDQQTKAGRNCRKLDFYTAVRARADSSSKEEIYFFLEIGKRGKNHFFRNWNKGGKNIFLEIKINVESAIVETQM